ncbi:hypothetical protein SAMN05216325_10196 [Nitrosomonas marina]|uniref:Uncharacterized protein n=1 Tax=Nitrosomonas marina TaxID=917 RepID=A0A1H8AE67_9PROT|nr:hypothetical protein SAMN05216325_10196 [Nitrosomonas marina]
MSEETDLKRRKIKTAVILFILVIAIYAGAFFYMKL